MKVVKWSSGQVVNKNREHSSISRHSTPRPLLAARRLSAPPSVTSHGFSLIELIVVMGILGVITTFSVASFRTGQRGDEIRIAAQLMGGVVRRAQTAALSGETALFCRGGAENLSLCSFGSDPDCTGGVCVRAVPPGYGVRIAAGTGEAVFFADTDGDGAFDAVEAIRKENFSNRGAVVVDAVSPSLGGALDIVFAPPKPSTDFNAGAPDAIASVTLRHTVTGAVKRITVNKVTGQVSIE